MALAELLDARTRPGTLYEKLEDRKVRCFACAHRCVIFDGKRGICQVRFNKDGTLYVPWGYVSSLGLDPIEKKPFYHVLPGARTLTFGMLGCDLHCPYCLAPGTRIATTRGMTSIENLFRQSERVIYDGKAEIAFPQGLIVYTHTGQARQVRAIFRHRYEGPMLRIYPAFLPPLECTPDHRLLAIPKPKRGRQPQQPSMVRAEQLTRDHCLAVPKKLSCSREVVLDVPQLLFSLVEPARMRRELTGHLITRLVGLTTQGLKPLKIGVQLGRSRSWVDRVQRKLATGTWQLQDLQRYDGKVIIEGGYARLFNEHAPGIPQHLPLDTRLARLLGYYCAEGCVWRDRERRANSAMLTFSFGKHERKLAEEVQELLKDVFGIKAHLERRKTTQAVVSYKSSLGLFFESLCGSGAQHKHVPFALFEAPREAIAAFLSAYVEGDGTRYPNGLIVTSTVSEEMAYGIAWLALKLGMLPSLRVYRPVTSPIEGRAVRRSPQVYRVQWWEDPSKRRCWEDENYFYIPIRAIEQRTYQGYVYNMEVELDHSYLAGFISTSNCQNWMLSQTLRDRNAGALPHDVTPQELVGLAQRYGAQAVISSYNEPLITSEWAVAIFQEAKRAGLLTGYVSNGNATREVLQYLRPHLDCYKIDLKTFQDKNYRVLGAVLSKILEGIALVHELGFWLEIVTLVVPGFNDSDEELRQIAKFLVSISPDIPWHVTAFHKDYKMTDPDNTPAETLIRAAQIGYDAGLHFVYTGNLPGMTGRYENTYCPGCGALLIERYGFAILQNKLRDGRCPQCGRAIPGVWKI
jgi:pyruvate formate lyase activating enzyme